MEATPSDRNGSDPNTPEQHTQKVLARVLEGKPPNGTPPEKCGRFAGAVKALTDAPPEDCAQRLRVLRRANPALDRLAASLEDSAEGGGNSFFQNPTHKAKERKNGSEALFQTAAEITRRGLPETSWLVPDLLPEAALVLLTGAAKSSGKTTFAMLCARALLRGTRFLGEEAARSPVVYLTEQAERSLHNEYLIPAEIESAEDLYLLHGYRAASMSWESVAEAAARRAAGTGARLLVVDTFMHFAGLRGEEENSSGAVQHALRPLQHAAAKHGLTVVVVHHDRKAGGDVFSSGRGSSAFQGVVDLILNLRRPSGNHDSNVRELRTAGRFSGVPNELMIELTGGGPSGTYRSLGSGPDVAARKARKALKEALPTKRAEAQKQDDLVEAAREAGADVSKTTIHKALKKLVRAGEARETGEGVRGDPYCYFRPLSDPPPQAR